MDKPDLHALAARAESLHDALEDFQAAVRDAYGEALGEYDEATESAVDGTASGDDPSYFESAERLLGEAKGAVGDVQRTLATVQGFRDFAESGSVPA